MTHQQQIADVLEGRKKWAVLTADCLDVLPLIPAGSVDAVVTDPPFGMDFQSNHRLDKHKPIAGDSDDGLVLAAVSIPATHSRYVFCRWNNLRTMPEPKSVITWVKNNWSMGDLEHEHGRQTEIAAFYPGPGHEWTDGRPPDVVYHDRTGNNLHPTEKPVSLMLQIVRWTRGVVIDPFAGSGTTGVACVMENRPFIGIEKDPEYAAVARRRISEAANHLFAGSNA